MAEKPKRGSSIKLGKLFNLSHGNLHALSNTVDKKDEEKKTTPQEIDDKVDKHQGPSKSEMSDPADDNLSINFHHNSWKLMDISENDDINLKSHGILSNGTMSKTPDPDSHHILSSNGTMSIVANNVGASKTKTASKNNSVMNLNNISSATSVNTMTRSKSRNSTPPMSRSNSVAHQKPRFKMCDDGLHEHNLKSAKRQEKLSNMLKDLLGAKKLRDEAKSAVPNILGDQLKEKDVKQPPTLFSGLVTQVKKYQLSEPSTTPIDQSFVEKYGRCQEVVGKGTYGTVRISHKKIGEETDEEILYAVKEFKRNANELEKKFNRRLTSEFCILSSLKNINIIDTLDLLKDAKGDYCEVMEFCPGGDLYTLIIALGKLEYAEADCFFKQLIKGVNYMHDMGVAHRDLKPENVLLTHNGVLKITDFGNSECFRMAWEKEIQLSEGICGSSPYIAPEEFTSEQFDPRCVDIWSCGVIYMAMRTGRQLWSIARETDEFFKEYLIKRKNSTGYEPIESLKRARCRNVIYSILDPKPSRRITGKQILNSEWGREIKLCLAAQGKR